ncbi:hypothetical protein [Streptomyces sp. NPDC001536]|uniref:hypothetical protein n=1 Tax=Streptomyces sp. NPDC001536 TaxID=3364583 RepID=UPI0036CDE9D4
MNIDQAVRAFEAEHGIVPPEPYRTFVAEMFGAEFGFTTSAPGFVGWVAHWAAGKKWFYVGSAE